MVPNSVQTTRLAFCFLPLKLTKKATIVFHLNILLPTLQSALHDTNKKVLHSFLAQRNTNERKKPPFSAEKKETKNINLNTLVWLK
jgi:hypothetical protein